MEAQVILAMGKATGPLHGLPGNPALVAYGQKRFAAAYDRPMEAGRRYHVGDLRGRLMREARDMLDEGGLKQLNLRALAARAGLTAGAMYHH